MGSELKKKEGDGGGDQEGSRVLVLTLFCTRVKGNSVSPEVSRAIAMGPQEEDPSYQMRTKFQGIAVLHYVETQPSTNLKIWGLFLCKDSKSHCGINVFIFK